MAQTNTEINEGSGLEKIVHILSLLWKYRLLIIIMTGSITVLVTVFCFVSVILPPERSPLPSVYLAEATILVQESTQSDIASSIFSALGMSQGSSIGGQNNGDLVLEVLNSRVLIDALVDEFGIIDKYNISQNKKGTSREIMRAMISYTYSASSGALKISSQNIDPVFAKNLVNRTVQLLEEWFNQNRGLARQRQKQSLEDKLNEVKASIDSLQNRLKSLQKQYGVLNVEELGQTQAASLANLRSQLILKEVEIKNYTSFSKIDDPRLEQLKEERQNLLDLIAQNQQTLPEAQGGSGASSRSSKSLADVAQEFSQLTLELDIQQRIYNTLSPQYEAIKLTPESDPIFQVLEWADVPDTKSGPKRSIYVLASLALSLCASIAISLLINSVKKLNLRKIKEIISRGA